MQLNDFQKENFKKILTYLESLPEDYKNFSMHNFFSSKDASYTDPEMVKNSKSVAECGTSACVVGHGPFAGIEVLYTDMGWFGYSSRCFIDDDDSPEWNFCFSCTWDQIEPTLQDAIVRIKFFILNGYKIPAEWTDGYDLNYEAFGNWTQELTKLIKQFESEVEDE